MAGFTEVGNVIMAPGGSIWRGTAAHAAQQQHVPDIAIANRDTITLSVPFGKIAPNTFTAAEIRYLESHGYQRVGAKTLTHPAGGKP